MDKKKLKELNIINSEIERLEQILKPGTDLNKSIRKVLPFQIHGCGSNSETAGTESYCEKIRGEMNQKIFDIVRETKENFEKQFKNL